MFLSHAMWHVDLHQQLSKILHIFCYLFELVPICTSSYMLLHSTWEDKCPLINQFTECNQAYREALHKLIDMHGVVTLVYKPKHLNAICICYIWSQWFYNLMLTYTSDCKHFVYCTVIFSKRGSAWAHTCCWQDITMYNSHCYLKFLLEVNRL